MRALNSLTILFICIAHLSFSQEIQWADSLVGYSSELVYDKYPGQYLAKEVLGKPSVLNQYISHPCSWAPLKPSNPDGEWIEVAFSKPQKVRQVVVNEGYNPGALIGVILKDTEFREYTVFLDSTRVKPTEWKPFLVKLDQATSYKVGSVKLLLNTGAVGGHNQIDAIGITDSSEDINLEINAIRSSSDFDFSFENVSNINSPTDELCPIVSPDGRTLYFTRQDHPENFSKKQDIWMSSIEEGIVQNPVRLEAPLNNEGHNSMSSISPDGQTAGILNVYNEDGSISKGFSVTTKKETGWEWPIQQEIDDYYNDSKYGEYFISNSGTILLMTLMRKESVGHKDIYVSFKKGDNEWTKPLSLGPDVNTAASEIFPFLAADNRTLYFATRGWPTYGKADVFVSRRIGEGWTNWTEPINLGPKINSKLFDAYYSITANGEYVYMVSQREGTLGKSDIFRAKLPDELKPYPVALVKGTVRNAKDSLPLTADINYYSIQSNTKMGEAKSDNETGRYQIVLPAEDIYGFSALSKGFIPVSQNIDLTEIREYKEVEVDLYLVPIEKNAKITLNNIYFDTDKSELKRESFVELNELVKIIKANTGISIEISGHTDDVGSDDYNQKLSERRAKAVVDYLILQGIAKDKLTFVGYGESQPAFNNDTAENRNKNRRVEFTVTSIN